MTSDSDQGCDRCRGGQGLHVDKALTDLLSISIWSNKDMQREMTSREIDRALLAHNANVASIAANNLESELAAILGSRSWRLTAPLRGLERLIKKIAR
jgi:hypothetical protein